MCTCACIRIKHHYNSYNGDIHKHDSENAPSLSRSKREGLNDFDGKD